MHRNYLFFFLTISGLLSFFQAFSQEKKHISHEDYAMWRQISSPLITPNGQWVVYGLNPQDGDGALVIRNLDLNFETVVARGENASVSPGGKYVVFRIRPEKSIERQAKLDKKKNEEMPVDSLGIYLFETRELIKYPALERFSLPKSASDWLTYVIDHSRLLPEKIEQSGEEFESHEEKTVVPGEKQEEGVEHEEEGKYRETIKKSEQEIIAGQLEDDEGREDEERPGKVLYISNPITGESIQVEYIANYAIAENGNLVVGLTEKKQKDTLSLWDVFTAETQNLQATVVDSRIGDMKHINLDKDGQQLAWLFSSDTTNSKSYDLYHYDMRRGCMQKLINAGMPGMPGDHGPSEHSRPYFSDDGRRLFLGTAPIPIDTPEDTLLSEETYSLDIWHWMDPMLQSQQKVLVNRHRRMNFPAVYHLQEGKLVQLGDEDMPQINLDATSEGRYAMGQGMKPYLIERQWTGGNPRDLYAVNLTDGQRKLVAERVEASASVSPAGNYIIWYDTDQTDWKTYSFSQGTVVNLTAGIDVPMYNEDDDMPIFANPHGIAGWTSDDNGVLIYDRYDVWLCDPDGNRPPKNLTNCYGREHGIELRIQNLDRDDPFVRLDQTIYLRGFNERNKQSGFFGLTRGQLTQLVMADASMEGLHKAGNSDRYIFTRSTFSEFPDLWFTCDEFDQAERFSDANPWKKDFLWGSVRLVEWNDLNNNTLEGMLYLPEDFDEGKTYPMIVYFYDRSSNGLHRHFIPAPSRSTINRTYCTSNGYIVFVPDITYVTGYPGESAYNAVVSGTKAMVDRYPFIDRDRIGLQGQSWGGYQIAYIITRTNMFRAAMAGAPVSNMISAYGGIRWQSGLNRQFQYEQSQSRIGGSLWEKPLRYIENSPIFYADKIETPLLMMHNDNDGAVPWYQGIELFTALRRLSKPVWMLVYNGEAHNLTKWPNRMDLSVRMYQFFDFYLKDEPTPVWLKYGVPAIDKGRVDGYELVE